MLVQRAQLTAGSACAPMVEVEVEVADGLPGAAAAAIADPICTCSCAGGRCYTNCAQGEQAAAGAPLNHSAAFVTMMQPCIFLRCSADINAFCPAGPPHVTHTACTRALLQVRPRSMPRAARPRRARSTRSSLMRPR